MSRALRQPFQLDRLAVLAVLLVQRVHHYRSFTLPNWGGEGEFASVSRNYAPWYQGRPACQPSETHAWPGKTLEMKPSRFNNVAPGLKLGLRINLSGP